MTPSASTILARLGRIGGTVSIVDGRLVIEAPEGAVGGDLLRAVRCHKSDLLALLIETAPEQDPWPDGRPDWTDRIMDGDVAAVPPAELPEELRSFARPDDKGILGYRAHLARIRRYAASKAESAKTEPTRSLVPAVTGVARPVGGPIRQTAGRLRPDEKNCQFGLDIVCRAS